MCAILCVLACVCEGMCVYACVCVCSSNLQMSEMAEAPHPAMNLPTMMIQTAEAPAITTQPISSQGYKTYFRRPISKLERLRYYLCFKLSACTKRISLKNAKYFWADCGHVSQGCQGDQIGRNFAIWAIF